jgi:hypothetical protein
LAIVVNIINRTLKFRAELGDRSTAIPLPNDRDRILRNERIVADYGTLFSNSLSDKQSIKWVLVVGWQLLQFQYMVHFCRQNPESIPLCLQANDFLQGFSQNQLPEHPFNLNFSEADDA